MDRRQFLKVSLSAIAGLSIFKIPGFSSRETEGAENTSNIFVAKDPSPETATVKALNAVGGMGKFVRKGEKVVIKPNIGWARTPEQAANTHPDVVKVLVQACKKAGASQVIVLDMPCNPWEVTYVKSGIQKAVEEAGGTMHPPQKFRKVSIPGESTYGSRNP